MKTTIELPDDLFRQAKAKAAMEGVRLRDLVERGIRLALAEQAAEAAGHRTEFPLIRSQGTTPLEASTVAVALAEMDDAEMLHVASSVRR